MTHLNETVCSDSELKNDADGLFSGLSVTAEAPADLFYSETNLEHIRKGIEDTDYGKGVEHPLIED